MGAAEGQEGGMKSMGEQASAAVQWWRGLQPNTATGERNRTGDRAALARLRRADLLAAMSDPATFELFRELGRGRPEELPEVALCAGVLVGVREHQQQHPARALGPGSPGEVEQAPMNRLRFRRLVEADTPEERLILLRRAVQLADRRLNVRELAAACLDWSPVRRRRWIFEYYNAGFAAPTAERNLEISQA
jgi:CRISPR system Cascade subunit CasB